MQIKSVMHEYTDHVEYLRESDADPDGDGVARVVHRPHLPDKHN